MANTYTQRYIHVVFAVKGRQSLIPKLHQEELHKYMTGIVQGRKQKMLAVHCMPDHAHLLVSMPPTITIADLVRDVKTGPSSYINRSQWAGGNFNWQAGYGTFSYAHSQLDHVISNILNQEEHHRVKTFREEYTTLLDKFQIAYDQQYLFEWVEEPCSQQDRPHLRRLLWLWLHFYRQGAPLGLGCGLFKPDLPCPPSLYSPCSVTTRVRREAWSRCSQR